MTYSPDGTRIVSGGADGTVEVWEADSGLVALTIECKGKDREVRSVAVTLGRIPKSWEVHSIAQLFTIRSGGTPSRAAHARYFQGGNIPWVKTMDLNEGVITNTNELVTATALRESACELMPQGTLLVAMYGGWEQIGRTGLLGMAAATNQAMVSLVSIRDNIDPEFVLLALQHGRWRWKRVAASTRKDPNITKDDVAHFQIALPDSQFEQSLIKERMQELDSPMRSEESALPKLKLQKRGLMHDLLTGRVRV